MYSNRLQVTACCRVRRAMRGVEPTHNARTPSSLTSLARLAAPPSCARVRSTSGVRGERGDAPGDGAGDQRVQRGDLSSPRGGEVRHRGSRLGVHQEVQAGKRSVARQRRAEAAEQPARALFAGHLPQRVPDTAVGHAAHRRVLHARLDHGDGAQQRRGERAGRRADGGTRSAPFAEAPALSPSAFGKRWLSSRETRSRSRKYRPAPAAVRTHDAVTPAHKPRTPSSRTTHPAVANMPLVGPMLSLCACIRVLTTSNGCSARLETRPAEEPAMNEAVPLLVPGVPADRFDASTPRLGRTSAAIVAAGDSGARPIADALSQPPGETAGKMIVV